MRNSLLLLALLLSTLSLFSQNKYEREQRIKFSELPESCQAIINTLSIPTKIKCYKETRLDGFSYEVKTKVNKQKISIELDSNCVIEDVELLVKFNALDKDIQEKVTNYLNENYTKHSVIKTQIQLVCSEQTIKEYIADSNYPYATCLNGYEIIVRCKNNEGEFLYELFFDKEGNLHRKEKIITKNTSNLEF